MRDVGLRPSPPGPGCFPDGGARMGRAAVAWTARQTALSPWELDIPGLEGWYVGANDAWADDGDGERLRS